MMGKESVPALILAKVHLRIRDLTHNAGETGTLIPISPHKSVKKPDRHDPIIPSAIRGHGHGHGTRDAGVGIAVAAPSAVASSYSYSSSESSQQELRP